MTWEFDGVPITDEKYEISYNPEEDMHYLTILDSDFPDSGKYSAVATNDFGKATCTAEMLVEGTFRTFIKM